jgi:hypothetical protein
MKAAKSKAAIRGRDPLEDLLEALRHMAEQIRWSFDWRNNGFNPRDPRLVTVVLALLAAWLGVALLAALFSGQS